MRPASTTLSRRVAIIVAAAVLAWWGAQEQSASPLPRPESSTRWQQSDDPLLTAFLARRSNVQIESQGVVKRVLPDDNDGSRHQRFLLEGPSGRTVLVAHNIDLAPRIADLEVGARITFNGEYEWNDRGGVIHWTHRDPRGRHVGGWIEHRGRRYE